MRCRAAFADVQAATIPASPTQPVPWPGLQPMTPRVSVCLGVKNGIANAERFIAAVRAQTYPHVELVVADNFSADGSAEIFRAAADVFLQIGPERSAQRNAAMQRATGDLVIIL